MEILGAVGIWQHIFGGFCFDVYFTNTYNVGALFLLHTVDLHPIFCLEFMILYTCSMECSCNVDPSSTLLTPSDPET